jgi:hypothetical protein
MKTLYRLRLGFTTAAVALLALPGSSVEAEDGGQTLERMFAHPPVQARPRVRWWWPGNAVTEAELKREIRLFRAAGFGGAEIQSFNTGVPGLSAEETTAINTYASPKFFDHVRAAVAEAQSQGLSIDYTLGSSWPTGGGLAITPELAMMELVTSVTQVDGTGAGNIQINLPKQTRRLAGAFGLFGTSKGETKDWPYRFKARSKLIAVLAVKGTGPSLKPKKPGGGFAMYSWQAAERPGQIDPGSTIDLTSRLREDGTLDWSPPPGTWQVVAFRQFVVDAMIGGAANTGPQLVQDHMNPAAFAAMINRVAAPLIGTEGKVVPGIRSTFVDSLELFQDIAWTNNFLEQFKARRGYDLKPYLPFIIQPGWKESWGGVGESAPYFDDGGTVGDRVRADYRQTVSELMYEGFTQPFAAWTQAHGVKMKFQAHGGPHDLIKSYGAADIPEVESLGGNEPLGMRLGRSAADIYGRRIVSSESLGYSGRPYSPTLHDMRRLADVNFAGGVNSLIYHGYSYRLPNRKWPGWHAFQPGPGLGLGFGSMINEGNPLWAGVPTLNAYVARTQAVLQQGRPVVPIAYFLDEAGSYDGSVDHGGRRDALAESLMAGGYDFDRVNPEGLRAARVQNGALVTQGGARYNALVLPPLRGMSAEVAEQLSAFAKAGLPVLFVDSAPVRDVTLADHEARDRRVKAAIAESLQSKGRVVPLAQLVETLCGKRVRSNLTFSSRNPAGLTFVQRHVGPQTVTFLYNSSSEVRDASLVLPGTGGVARWLPMDGTRETLSTRRDSAGVGLRLQLGARESALLVQDTRTPVGPQPRRRIAETRAMPVDGWSLSVKGHGPQGEALEREFNNASLGDWAGAGLANFSGEGIYRRAIMVPASWTAKGTRLFLDLGIVHDMAIVTLNGRALPPAIAAPYRVDLTPALRAGQNELDIAIYNSPNNAMIDPKRLGFKDLKPVPAGLIGPARVEVEP